MLTKAWTPLRYHELQARLWRSKARFINVAAGRGSGKTEIARRYIVRMLPVAKPWSNPMYFYGLPTYKQARRVAWRPIKELVPHDWIKTINETEMRIDTVFGSSLYILGLDKPARIEGDQWDGGVLDESCDQRPNVFSLSVLPALSHRAGWCRRIGVPKRFGVGAAEFKDAYMRGVEAGYGSDHESYTWSSEDILSKEQLRWAKENLDAKDYDEQYRASWEDISGLIFYAYDDILNVAEGVYNPSMPLIVGSDFNVDPMAWVVCQRGKNANELYVLDEMFVRNTNTQACLDMLFKRWGSHQAGFEFYGDASGRARNTRASESDYLQIRNDTRFSNARVFYPQRNPSRKNRFAACNAMFCNALSLRRCFIAPRCKHLRKDLLSRAYLQGTTEVNDKTDSDLGHISDAFGYVIHSLFPIILQGSVEPKVYISV